jgi:uncharacterized protein YuzE
MAENNPINVMAAFEILLEELEAEVEAVSEAGARAFSKHDRAGGIRTHWITGVPVSPGFPGRRYLSTPRRGRRQRGPRRGGDGVPYQQDRQIHEKLMKVIYDPEVDVLRIILNSAAVAESDEDKPGVILDYDRDGNVVGLEILNASARIENPRSVEYAVTA